MKFYVKHAIILIYPPVGQKNIAIWQGGYIMNKGTKFALKCSAILLAVLCPITVIIYSVFFPEQIPLGIFLALWLGIVYYIGLDTGYNKGRSDALKEKDEEDAPEEVHK